jgi:hypothetical protein
MFAYCWESFKHLDVDVCKDAKEPIKLGLGKYSELSIHMTRDEALDLMSQLEKAIHQTAGEVVA